LVLFSFFRFGDSEFGSPYLRDGSCPRSDRVVSSPASWLTPFLLSSILVNKNLPPLRVNHRI